MTHPIQLRSAGARIAPTALALAVVLGAAFAGLRQDPKTAWTQAELERTSLAIQKDVEELRGAKFKGVVPVKVATKQEFVDFALEFTERTEPAEKRAADEMIMKMLGLIPTDMDLLQESIRLLESQAAGVYDPGSKSFFLMESCPQAFAKVVLSHELAHALDDQLYDLDGGLKRVSMSSDLAQAYSSVAEGSGTSVMNRWLKTHPKQIDAFALLKMQAEQTDSLKNVPLILWKPLVGRYLTGAAFLARTESVWDGQQATASNADLDQAFRSPPQSTEQVLHPAKYWDSEHRDEPIAVHQMPKGELPAEWKILRRDVMGELTLGIWCISQEEREKAGPREINSMLGMAYTRPASEGWGGDEVLLLGKGEKARALRWLTVWDSARDAAEFFGAASIVVDGLEATLAKLAGGKKSQACTAIRYGSEREVVIELGFGLKRAELEAVLASIQGS